MKTFFLTSMVVALTTLFSFNVCQAQGPYGLGAGGVGRLFRLRDDLPA